MNYKEILILRIKNGNIRIITDLNSFYREFSHQPEAMIIEKIHVKNLVVIIEKIKTEIFVIIGSELPD